LEDCLSSSSSRSSRSSASLERERCRVQSTTHI
jgi:hypothetical protein